MRGEHEGLGHTRAWSTREADSRTQELAALVEHISRLPDPPEPWDAD